MRILRRLGAGELDAAQAQGAVRALLSQVERSPREAYRRYAERLVQHNCVMAADIHNTTTPAQRRTASQKLKGWAAELRELARPSGA